MDLDPETQVYITAGVLGTACLVLIVLVSILYTRITALTKRIDAMQSSGKLRVQKLRNATNHAFQNPALAPDEELSKRGYSMYQPSEPDIESQRGAPNDRHSHHQGPAYVEELTRELDSRHHSTAPSFLLTAIQENKRKSKHLNNPMAKETRGSDTNPNFMY